MKYSMPKINMSMLRSAKDHFNAGINEYKERLLKKDTTLIEACFTILRSFFSTMGHPNLSTRLQVKEDSPRTSPSSRHYNKFLAAAESDLHGAYDDHNELRRAISSHWNYSQSNRGAMDGILSSVNQRLTDFAIISQSVGTRDIWFKESFNTMDRVELDDGKYIMTRGYVNLLDGIYTLAFRESEDILVPDNIKSINDIVEVSTAFKYSEAYRGRQYGVVDNMNASVPSDRGIRLDTNSKGDTWDTRSVRNLVDPDEVDTYWEVEVTAREDWGGTGSLGSPLRSAISTTGAGKNSGGPLFFLGNAGLEARVWKDGDDSSIYHHPNGAMYYNSQSYPADFFLDSEGGAVRHELHATIEIVLKEEKAINTIRITRMPVGRSNIDGTDHIVKVGSIHISTEGTTWYNIPGRFNNDLYRSLNATTRVVGDSDDELRQSTSQFMRTDSWNFPTRTAKYINVNLYTYKPYLIRYSMDRHSRTTEASTLGKIFLGSKDKVAWLFLQRGGATAVQIDSGEVTNFSLTNIVKYIILGPVGGAIWSVVSSLWKGKEQDMNPVAEETHTLGDPDEGDVYRWSLELSDITATTNHYLESSELLSTMYVSPQAMDRILLYVNHELSGGAIEYYIIPEGGVPYRIQPMELQDDRSEAGYIPKILYVNSNLPEDRREKTKWGAAAYIDTEGPLHKFRLRAILTRGGAPESTPRILDYKVRIVPKALGGIVRHVE